MQIGHRCRGILLSSVLGAGLFGAMFVGACAASPLSQVAARGDWQNLRREIASKQKAGSMKLGEARDIARSVAKREIDSAKGLAGAQRISLFASCVREVDSELKDKMGAKDEAGAEAALLLFRASKLSESDARDHLTDSLDGWRGLAAHGLTRDDDRAARVRALIDGSPLVRRGAIHSAKIAKDTADVEPLLETARLDPEPLVRSEAVRALRSLPMGGRTDVANRLRDLWANADDALREDIALAWTAPEIYGKGGREALRAVVGTGKGSGAIEAAALLTSEWKERDADTVDLATAHLVRMIDGGSTRERAHAIAVVRIAATCAPKACRDPGGALLEAVRRAAKSDDVAVALGALGRLTENANDKANAVRELERLAQPTSPYASRARMVLAGAGDVRVQAWIEQDLSSQDPWERVSAATALEMLGRVERAATLLADDDAMVRARVACAIVGR